jgi:hypothetical protein
MIWEINQTVFKVEPHLIGAFNLSILEDSSVQSFKILG